MAANNRQLQAGVARAYNEEGGYQCFNSIVSPLATDIIVQAVGELLADVWAL